MPPSLVASLHHLPTDREKFLERRIQEIEAQFQRFQSALESKTKGKGKGKKSVKTSQELSDQVVVLNEKK